jgi:TfoX/Sxy family transcriptional regulator of competence genes
MAYDEFLAVRLRAEIGSLPGIVEKKMFGGIGFILDGNMAVGVLDSDLLVRVQPEAFDDALRQPHTSIMDNFGRAMKGWLKVSPPGVETQSDLQKWVEVGLAAAKALPKK